MIRSVAAPERRLDGDTEREGAPVGARWFVAECPERLPVGKSKHFMVDAYDHAERRAWACARLVAGGPLRLEGTAESLARRRYGTPDGPNWVDALLREVGA